MSDTPRLRLLFSQRRIIEAMFRVWARDNKAAASPANMIAWLQSYHIDFSPMEEVIESNRGLLKPAGGSDEYED